MQFCRLSLQLHVQSLTQTPVARPALSRQWTLIVFLVSRLRTCHKHLMTLIGAINDFIMGTDSSCSLQNCPLQCSNALQILLWAEKLMSFVFGPMTSSCNSCYLLIIRYLIIQKTFILPQELGLPAEHSAL